MNNTVANRISKMLIDNPNATKVCFANVGSNITMSIDEFLSNYGNRECGLNGEIYFADGTMNVNIFIKYLY